MFNKELFSYLVKTWRHNKPLRQFAKESGISIATVSRIENGHLPDIETFMKMCNHCCWNTSMFMHNGNDIWPTIPDLSNLPFEVIQREFNERVSEMANRLL